jgi:hypothetical protein
VPRRDPKPETVLQVLVRRVGFIRAGKVLSFVTCWIAAAAELAVADDDEATIREMVDKRRQLVDDGRDGGQLAYRLTVEEYAKFWNVSRSGAYREQQWFREAFAPEGFQTPDDLIAALPMADATAAPGIALAVWPA